MIRSVKHLMSIPVQAIDGPCGKVDDFLMSEKGFDVRHLVADIGQWPSNERVIISRQDFQQMVNRSDIPSFPVRMLSSQVMRSFVYDPGSPVLAGEGESFAERSYMTTPHEQGSVSRFVAQDSGKALGRPLLDHPETHALHSVRELVGLPVDVMDGSFGYVSDFLVDDSDWALQYLVVDSNRWLPGGSKYCIHIKRLDKIQKDRQGVEVKLKKNEIEELPEYSADRLPAVY